MISLLFSVRGRINRAQYWLGSFITGAVFLGGFIVAGFAASSASDNAPKTEAVAAGAGMFALILLPLVVFVLWSALAVQIKRFHDRGRSWYFVLLPFLPLVLMVMAIMETIARGGSPFGLALSLPYMVISWAINLYLFVELGCLAGVEGDNKYGPPPGSSGGTVQPTRPTGAVEAASALFGAQAAMDRAIADARNPQAQPRPSVAPTPAQTQPRPAMAQRGPLQSAAPSFGRRVTP